MLSTTACSSSNIKKDKDNIAIYTADAIQSTAGVKSTQGGLLLIAILCGGDYNKVCFIGVVLYYGIVLTSTIAGWTSRLWKGSSTRSCADHLG